MRTTLGAVQEDGAVSAANLATEAKVEADLKSILHTPGGDGVIVTDPNSYAPFEKIPEIAEKVYSAQRKIFGHLEGRKELLEALKSFAISQNMTTVLVEGESGMGKTNLVLELKRVSQELGIRTIHSINQESDRTNR